MPVEIGQIESEALRDQVLDAIEQALISGKLRPGDRINEANIARQAGISRGPVREAIQHLVAENILVKIPNRGTFVAEWTTEDVAETYGLRALLESYAARLAKERISDEEFHQLEAIIDEMFDCAQRGDSACLTELDSRFHHLLYDISSHKLLKRQLDDLWRRISMLVSFDAETSPDLIEYAQNHRMLLDAIGSGDGEKIEEVFREHIVSIGEGLVRRMEDQKESEEI